MAEQSETAVIMNENTCKHFRRSILPKITDIPHYLEDRILSGILQNAQKQCTASLKSESRKNTQETQTDYRESEAQTEPWESPYKIVPGHNPEILTLAHLTWEHGLPAGVHEIHIINRMQMKRAWETILPLMDTPANIKIRNSIITMLEIDEWAFRESEIQFITDLRLNLMKDLMQSHESQNKKKVKSRFNRLQNKLMKNRDDQVKTIRHNLKRNLRKLCRKYDNQSRKPDLIEGHIGLKFDLYEPQMRLNDKYSERRHEKLGKQFLNESCAVQQNEKEDIHTSLNWLPTIEEPKVIDKRKSKSIDICIRETRWTEEKLKQLHFDLKAIRKNVKSVDVIPRLIKRNYKQSALPVTPRRLSIWNNKQKQQEESATFIQKLVKGRATQCLMYEGRDRNRELIEELHLTQTLEQDEQKQHEKIHTIELQQLQNDQLLQEDRLCEILNSLEGKTICGILDFLSKEQVRLEDERRAHAFALLAERERCMREAAEAGKRQLERNRRREFDEMFKQIVKVNQDSIEAYLENITREGVDWMSDKTAKEQVLQLYDKVDDKSKYAPEKQDCADKSTEEELVTDMIYNFVLPEVEKHNMRRKTHERQDYMRNAYISIYETILNLPSIKPLQEQDIETDEVEFPFHKTEEKKQI
ncbi:cilia- and flagella-associated protein 91 isoform X2 [Anoplolepis gracilipes]|uniref:cilia- and flagella-associated protein 91 isoform X2 n=1 Tax=Anoplolepis gracilipes TaxID=354296 RepID=UPI003BA2AB96